MNKPIQIYALRLADGKYYIGQTNHPVRRLTQHKLGKGALYTQLHEPLEILHCEEFNVDRQQALYFENKLTLEYMQQYGWKNVRGGAFYMPNDDTVWRSMQNKLHTRFHKIHPRLLNAFCTAS